MAQPQVIVVGNEKGGAGKSTLAIHIVTGLLHAGHKVAIIDLDLPEDSALGIAQALLARGMPVVLLSTAGDPPAAATLRGARVLKKPFRPADLARAIGAHPVDPDRAD